jgi:hypothetical protein
MSGYAHIERLRWVDLRATCEGSTLGVRTTIVGPSGYYSLDLITEIVPHNSPTLLRN